MPSQDFDADINITGDLLVSGTVDGRDVSADGIKLDSINFYTYSQDTAPLSPSLGETWYDTDEFITFVWTDPGTGADWYQIEGATLVGGSSVSFIDTGANPVTLTANNYIVSSSGGTVTLPTAVADGGRTFIIKAVGALVTVETNSTETIDGGDGITLSADSSVSIVSNGANWFII